MGAVEIPNPVRWYYSADFDAEWWHRGGATREEAIDKGIAEYGGEPFWIAECKSMVQLRRGPRTHHRQSRSYPLS